MVLNPRKTESMVITTRQKHQLDPLTLNLSLSEQSIKQVNEHKLLGITIDNTLEWQPHISKTCKTIARNLFLLSKLKPFVDTDKRLLFYNAHIKSHIDYLSTIWDGASDVNMKRLNSLHRRAAKLIYPNPALTTDQKLEHLNILPLNKHLLFNKGVMMFKMQQSTSPQYLRDLFPKQSARDAARRNNLLATRPRIDLCKTSFSYSGSLLWNQLPKTITNSCSLASFKAAIHKWLSTAP